MTPRNWPIALVVLIVTGSTALVATPAGFAQAATSRAFAIRSGVTRIDMKVPHRTGARPPAILLSMRPANARCSVLEYHYGNLDRHGRFQMALRCRQVPRGARARLTFRAPYVRTFELKNGTGSIRVHVDKPVGNALPLGALTTRPRDTDCRVTARAVSTEARQFTAAARMTCRGLPARARGVLSVGGLLAVGSTTVVSRAAQSDSPANLADASEVSKRGCTPANDFIINGRTQASWKDCYTGPFRLRPWQSQWVGIGLNPSCEAGWSRKFDALRAPAAWLAIGLGHMDVDLIHDPSRAWWYSWGVGLVTNWQFSGDITFNFKYRCFRMG